MVDVNIVDDYVGDVLECQAVVPDDGDDSSTTVNAFKLFEKLTG